MSIVTDFLSRAKGESLSIGLDIGHYSIKLVQVAHSKTGRKVMRAGIHVLKAGVMTDGAIQDQKALQEAIVALLERTLPDGEVNGDVLVSIAWSAGLLSDRINVHPQEGTSNEETILFQATSHSPFDDADITMDYKILGNTPENDMEVLLVAAKNSVLTKWAEFFREAGVQPTVMDVDSFAICNAYSTVAPPEDAEKAVAIINMGEQRTTITFLRDGKYHSTREIQSAAIDSYVRSVSRTLNVNVEQAQKLLRGEAFETVLDLDALKKNGENTDLLGHKLKEAIQYASEELSVGIDLAIQYFKSSEDNRLIDRLLITGGGASIPGIVDFLTKKLELEVALLNPMDQIEMDEGLAGGISNSLSNILAVAYGMAMRKI